MNKQQKKQAKQITPQGVTFSELLNEVEKLHRRAKTDTVARKLIQTAQEKWEEAGSYGH